MLNRFAVTTAAMCLAAPMACADDDVKREGVSRHREELTALEMAPLPAEALAGLTRWSSGGPVTAESIDGKVLLLVTWAHWRQTSFAELATAQRLHERFADNGLVVLGVHHERVKDWDAALQIAAAQNVTFPIALDETGATREALLIDGIPDYYLVDRAGNLRFADFLSSEVEKAVTLAIQETPDEAASLKDNLAMAEEAAERDASRTKSVAGGLRPGEVLSVDFDLPGPEAYRAARWPDTNTNPLSADDHQGKRLPARMGNEEFLDGTPDLKGRIVVIDFWATWCGPCKRAMPGLDKLQKDQQQDVVIIGISDEPKAKVQTYLRDHPHQYTQAVDQKRTLSGALKVRGIPHIVVMSTDGVIRWQGNPLQQNGQALRDVVESLVANDPGVKARRAAEEEHLRKMSG